jgi:hypothetical protein
LTNLNKIYNPITVIDPIYNCIVKSQFSGDSTRELTEFKCILLLLLLLEGLFVLGVEYAILVLVCDIYGDEVHLSIDLG